MAERLDFGFAATDGLSGPAKAMNASLDGLDGTLKETNKLLQEFSKNQDKATSTNKGVQKTVDVWNLAKDVFGFTKDAIVGVGKAFFDAVKHEETFRNQLKLLVGEKSGEQIADSLDKIRPVAIGTEDDLKKMTSSILGLGFSAANLKPVLAGALDIKALKGPEAAGQFIDVLGKIKARGEASKKDLIAINQMLGFKTAAKEGQRSGAAINAVLNDLTKKIGGPLGTASAKGAQGIETTFARLQELPGNFLEGFAKAGGIKTISGTFSNFLEVFGEGKPLFEKVQKAAVNAFDKITESLFGGFAGDEGKKKFNDFATAATVFFEELPPKIEKFVDVMTTLWDIGKAVIGTFMELPAVGEDLGDGLGTGFVDIQLFVADVVGDVTNKARELYNAALDFGANIWKGIRDGIVGGISAVKESVTGLGESIKDGIKAALGIRSPSKVFAEYGALSAQGFSQGLQSGGVQEGVSQAFSSDAISRAVGGGRAGVSVGGVTVNVTVSGSDGAQSTAEQIAARLEDILPGKLASLFDMTAASEGAV